MKIGRYVLALALFISAMMVFSNRGLIDNYVMREQLESLKRANQEIDNENRELRKVVYCLRTDLHYIEMVARNDLEMVKKGDLVYRSAR
ncbi:MAG TPA: septum formation initiator family protein [Syntrophales bacterium]|jgi:cell division protein FtsB|nr:septum formation initiator family protein [Syntrophales bacterium]HOH74089.1 septum formation initiator family protein [Syntrophales bacterium]HPN07951.1 septum formation initiator family protein [Syntrophales bacterium]HPX81798.1 septum formation initiator family protein [Syntrophales bacterium]HQB14183.1 septum formation initiator family protein [Syntrophales bacterium]